MSHTRLSTECNGLIYKRGCQEHFSPSAGGASLVCDIQPPLTIEDARLVSCPWVIPSQQVHLQLVATTPISFEN